MAGDATMAAARPRLAYLIDPRFQGGTSSSFVAEIAETSRIADVSVHALSGGLLRGQSFVIPVEEALAGAGLAVDLDPGWVTADMVVVHNPIFLAPLRSLPLRICARDLVVVTHENLLRPGGEEGFDVRGVLGRLDRAAVALRRWLAPVSPWNRRTVEGWLARQPGPPRWRIAPEDWTNVVSMPFQAPNPRPRDRRGRLSRAGLEKFPPAEVMDLCFPRHAEANVILGADYLSDAERRRLHWTLLPFGTITPEAFFGMIDFMPYFTAPTWTESFGRAIAEAVAAGKIVFAGPEAGVVFGDAVIVCRPEEVDGLVLGFVADPAAYAARVRRAQAALSAWGPEAFRARVARFFERQARVAA